MKTYLFSYAFQGSRWQVAIEAHSVLEAQMRVEAIGRAEYDGEQGCAVRVPRWWAKWWGSKDV